MKLTDKTWGGIHVHCGIILLRHSIWVLGRVCWCGTAKTSFLLSVEEGRAINYGFRSLRSCAITLLAFAGSNPFFSSLYLYLKNNMNLDWKIVAWGASIFYLSRGFVLEGKGKTKKLSFHRYSHSWWNGGLVHPILVSYWTMDIAKLRIASSRVPFMYRLVTEKFTLAWVLWWSPSLLRYSMKAVSADLGWRKYFCCRW